MTANFLDLRPDTATLAMHNGERFLDQYQIKGDRSDVSSDIATLFRRDFAGAQGVTIKARRGAGYLLRSDVPIDLEGFRDVHLDLRGATWMSDTRTRLEPMFRAIGCRDLHIWTPRGRGFNPTPYSGNRLERLSGTTSDALVDVDAGAAQTTLTAAVTLTDTSITVASTANFPDSGLITIDQGDNDGFELIYYTSKDATHFLGCTRAYGGTIADTYANSASRIVYGPAIMLTASGVVTALPSSAPGARRLYLGRMMVGQHSAITADNQMLMGFWLKAASGTPSVTIKIYDQAGTLITSSTQAITTTLAEYYVRLADGDVDPGYYVYPTLEKAASDGISVYYYVYMPYNSPKYKQGNDSAAYYDNGGFIRLVGESRADRNQRIFIHKMDVEGFAGDAFNGSGYDEDINLLGGRSRCNARQGLTWNNGQRYLADGITIDQPGRSGIDIEATSREVNGSRIRRVTVNNLYNFAGVTSDVGTSRKLEIDGLRVFATESTATLLVFSGRGGYLKNSSISTYPTLPREGARSGALDISAEGFDIDNVRVDGKVLHSGSGRIGRMVFEGVNTEQMMSLGARVKVDGPVTVAPHAQTRLTAQAASGQKVLSVLETWTFPPVAQSFTVVIDPDTANEEYAEVDTLTATSFTVTSNLAITHAVNAVVRYDGYKRDNELYAGSGIEFEETPGEIVGLDTQARLYADGTYKGKFNKDRWYPGGDNKLDVPIIMLRGESGGSDRPNNLRGKVTPANGATSVVVTFPTRTWFNPTVSAALVAGGSLVDGTEYGYVVAGHNLYGGPRIGATEVKATPTGANLSVRLTMQTFYQSASREMILALSVFRRLTGVSATFPQRWDWLPSMVPYELGANLRNNQVQLTDDGSGNLLWTAVSGKTYGYPASLAGYTSRTGDPNSNLWTPGTTDETGYERAGIGYHPIVTYSTFPMGVHPWITAIGLQGFTINWTGGTGAPTGAETVGWRILW